MIESFGLNGRNHNILGPLGEILKDLDSIRGFELIWNSFEGFIDAEIEFDY